MQYIKKISILMLSVIFIGVATSMPVKAQSGTEAAQGLQISPALVELNAAPGKTYNVELSVSNVTSSNLVFNSAIDDFGSRDETGTPKIIKDSKLPNTASVKTWVKLVSKFSLAGQQQKKVVAQITIPNNAEPGGHYGVLSFAGSAPELDGNGVGLSASAGTLLLIRVDGNITEKASLASFYTSNNNKQSSFFENSPIGFVVRIKNEGNIHIKPVGNIEVRDMFGGLVKNIKVNPDKKSNVLPDSIRRFDFDLKNDWMFGKYTANLTLGYGSNGQAITGSVDFWVIPYKLILAVLIALAAVILIFTRLIRRYNKHIISKSKNEEKGKKSKRSKN